MPRCRMAEREWLGVCNGVGLGHRSQRKGVVPAQCVRVVLLRVVLEHHRPAEGLETMWMGGWGTVDHFPVTLLQELSHCPS